MSHTATKGSVIVEELCGIYSFEQVHQMISTIVSNVEDSTSPIEILKSTFPMGNMTGAPKISAMKIIEELEATKRGLYSGAVGYFTPNNDFDFNVVIRSILKTLLRFISPFIVYRYPFQQYFMNQQTLSKRSTLSPQLPFHHYH